MLFCTNCQCQITSEELHDFSSNREGAKPICPFCFALGKISREDDGGMKVNAK